MRPRARADEVMGRLDVRDPVADRLRQRLLEGAGAELDGAHFGAEQVHALDVGALAAHVLGAHVDDALETEARTHRRGRHAVLAGAGLGDDAGLAEPAGEQRLPERVVDLVRAGMAEVLALQVHPLSLPQALGAVEGCGAADVRLLQVRELGAEALVVTHVVPPALELFEGGDERLRDVAPAVGTVAGLVR